MMRLFLFISGLLLCASAQAMEWKSDITLSPQPMTYSGPADSVAPGSIIGSTWSATASVQQVRFFLYLLQRHAGAEQQRDLKRDDSHRRWRELHHF